MLGRAAYSSTNGFSWSGHRCLAVLHSSHVLAISVRMRSSNMEMDAMSLAVVDLELGRDNHSEIGRV